MASAGPAAGRGASTATAPPGSGWRSGIPASPAVASMPGAVPITSTQALTSATMPYVVRLADKGPVAALDADPGLAAGLNVAAGEVAHEAIVA